MSKAKNNRAIGNALSKDELAIFTKDQKRKDKIAQELEQKGASLNIAHVEVDDENAPPSYYANCINEGFKQVKVGKNNGKYTLDERANDCLHHFNEWFDDLIGFTEIEISGTEHLDSIYQNKIVEEINQEFEAPAARIQIGLIPIPNPNHPNFAQLSEVYKQANAYVLLISPTSFFVIHRTLVLKKPTEVESLFDEDKYNEIRLWLETEYLAGSTIRLNYSIEFALPAPPKRFLEATDTEPEEELNVVPSGIQIDQVVGIVGEESESSEEEEDEDEQDIEEEEGEKVVVFRNRRAEAKEESEEEDDEELEESEEESKENLERISIFNPVMWKTKVINAIRGVATLTLDTYAT